MILISENADQVQTQNGTICPMCKQPCIGVNIHGLPPSLLKAHTTSHLHLMLPIGGFFLQNMLSKFVQQNHCLENLSIRCLARNPD